MRFLLIDWGEEFSAKLEDRLFSSGLEDTEAWHDLRLFDDGYRCLLLNSWLASVQHPATPSAPWRVWRELLSNEKICCLGHWRHDVKFLGLSYFNFPHCVESFQTLCFCLSLCFFLFHLSFFPSCLPLPSPSFQIFYFSRFRNISGTKKFWVIMLSRV